jgi:large subunit ribosomal protein L21
MYAILLDGPKQHKVAPGQELLVDYRDLGAGATLEFDRVLAYHDGTQLRLGQPTVAGAKVQTEVVGAFQGPKLVVQKLRRRKNSRRRTGHRQLFTKVRVAAISVP